MNVTKITVTFGGKVPAVQYGSVDIHITHEVELQDGDDPAQVTQEAVAVVKAAVIAEVEALPHSGGRSWLRAVKPFKDEDDTPPF